MWSLLQFAEVLREDASLSQSMNAMMLLCPGIITLWGMSLSTEMYDGFRYTTRDASKPKMNKIIPIRAPKATVLPEDVSDACTTSITKEVNWTLVVDEKGFSGGRP